MEAAYRFFDNDKVTPQKILQPHINATRQRISQSEREICGTTFPFPTWPSNDATSGTFVRCHPTFTFSSVLAEIQSWRPGELNKERPLHPQRRRSFRFGLLSPARAWQQTPATAKLNCAVEPLTG
jgi:hypothetical protein